AGPTRARVALAHADVTGRFRARQAGVDAGAQRVVLRRVARGVAVHHAGVAHADLVHARTERAAGVACRARAARERTVRQARVLMTGATRIEAGVAARARARHAREHADIARRFRAGQAGVDAGAQA